MIKNRLKKYYDMIEPDKDTKKKMLEKVLDSAPANSRKRWIPWAAAVSALAAAVLAIVLIISSTNYSTTGQTDGIVAAATQTPAEPGVTIHSGGSIDLPKTTDKTNTPTENTKEIKYYFNQAKFNSRIYVDSLQKLEDSSIAIAEVKVIKSVQRLATENELSLSLSRPRGCAITTVIINKVYKSDGVIKAGAEKKIIEYYTTRPNKENEKILDVYCSGNTMPMKIEGTYLLFLDKPSDEFGDYEIFGIWMGKFKVSEEIKNASDISKLSKEEIEAAKDKDKDHFYWSLLPQVNEKYINQKSPNNEKGSD